LRTSNPLPEKVAVQLGSNALNVFRLKDAQSFGRKGSRNLTIWYSYISCAKSNAPRSFRAGLRLIWLPDAAHPTKYPSALLGLFYSADDAAARGPFNSERDLNTGLVSPVT
jgi:hypothetical protein